MTIVRLDILDPTDTTIEWWSSTYGLKGVSHVDFTPGLNVLFAPNGYGKSTILKGLANLTHCRQAGVPSLTHESLAPWAHGKGKGVRLHSDGELCFYVDPSERPGLIGGLAGFDYDFLADGLISAMARVSAGEWCIMALNRMIASVFETKEMDSRGLGGMARVREMAAHKAWLETQVKVKGPGRRTLLLDEFDRSLDIPQAAHLWALLSRRIVSLHQVIVAGHSPVILQLADRKLCNLIELCPGYADACRVALAEFAAGVTDPSRATYPCPFKWKPPIALPKPAARKQPAKPFKKAGAARGSGPPKARKRSK